MNQLLIPVELLARQLQEIPGLKVSIKFDDPSAGSYSTDVLFEDWARRWLETYKKGIVKDNSFYGTYRNPVENHLIPYFGGHTLSEIRPPDVQWYFKSLQTTLSLETQKKIRSAMHAIYDTAIECGICISNPITKSLKLVSTVLPTEKNTWSSEQYDMAAKFALGHKYGLHIITLMETAITRSELLGMTWDNIDINKRTINLDNGLVYQKSTITEEYELVHDGLKTPFRHRSIPISKLLCGLLSLQPRQIIVKGHMMRPKYIFHAPSGGPYDPNNWYRRVLKIFMSDLHSEHPDVPILTTHELRHTRATLLKDEGKDLFSIARLLGHCDLTMLAKRYAHDNVEALRAALEI